jgi:LCP family protein required for cell wall assembly
MMNIFRKISSTPKNWKLFVVFWLFTIITIVLVYFGYYRIGKSLAYGVIGFPAVESFIGIESEDEIQVPTSEPDFSAPVIMPEGVLEVWDGTGRITVLVMGMDYRDWSSGIGPSRTDTMMLLTMDPLNNTAGMFSIPRDLWVSIPGFDNNRINTAYFLGEVYKMPGGGPAMAIKTVEQLLGVRINYYALVNFGAFVRLVEELDGVKIDVPARLRIDPIVGKPVILEPGRQTLGGELALAYARARNSAGGDLDRAIRQQQVIFGIRDRLLKPDSLTNLISKAPALYAEISNGVKTNLTLDEVIKFALMAQKIPTENIQRGAISQKEVISAMTPDGRSVLLPLTEKIRQLRDKVFLVSTGTLGPLTPGTQQEKMLAEGARIALSNGTGIEGTASGTKAILVSKGVNVVEISEWEFLNKSRIIDYTGNPHTVKFLSETFDIPPGSFELDFNQNSSVDIRIILGANWEN